MAINARAAQERRRLHAQYCAPIPEYRKALGAHSDEVVRLTALCQQAGYSSGD